MSVGVSVRPVVGNRQKSCLFVCMGWKQVIFHHEVCQLQSVPKHCICNKHSRHRYATWLYVT